MSWLTRSVNPGWIVVAILVANALVAAAAKGYQFSGDDVPGILAWAVVCGAVIWMMRFGVVAAARDDSARGKKHRLIVYGMVGALFIFFMILKVFFPDVFSYLMLH